MTFQLSSMNFQVSSTHPELPCSKISIVQGLKLKANIAVVADACLLQAGSLTS